VYLCIQRSDEEAEALDLCGGASKDKGNANNKVVHLASKDGRSSIKKFISSIISGVRTISPSVLRKKALPSVLRGLPRGSRDTSPSAGSSGGRGEANTEIQRGRASVSPLSAPNSPGMSAKDKALLNRASRSRSENPVERVVEEQLLPDEEMPRFLNAAQAVHRNQDAHVMRVPGNWQGTSANLLGGCRQAAENNRPPRVPYPRECAAHMHMYI